MKAILLDLDDTLLDNDMRTFLPAYFQSLAVALAPVLDPERLIEGLLQGTAAMDANDGSGPTNREAFEAVFYSAVGRTPAAVDPEFERFYAEEFPKLRALTRRRPQARALIELGFARGWQVAVATNPVFPRTAVEQRLDWAGVPAREFPYDLITTYENMHATKAHPSYYREILSRLNRNPGECLMVGDDRLRDIEPAAGEGIPVFWIRADGPSSGAAGGLASAAVPDRTSSDAGTLQLLLDRLRGVPPVPR